MVIEVERSGGNEDELRAQIAELQQLVGALKERNVELEQLVAWFKHRVYGKKSERGDTHPLLPFPDDELEAVPPPHIEEAPDDECDAVAGDANDKDRPRKPSRKRGVDRLRPDLPRVRQIIELPEDERRCPCCSEPMAAFGEEISEKLHFVPATLQITEIVRVKYACKEHEESGVCSARLPPQPIAKGMATAALVAQVIVAKFKDHLPLFRQSGIFARHGVGIPDSTLGDWIREGAGLVEPVVTATRISILESFVIQSDDTRILVQDKEHEGGSRTSFLWAYLGDRGEVVYDFTPGRTRDGPLDFLGGYRGYLQVDAYSGYDAVVRKGQIVDLGCWAHARRKFHESLLFEPEIAKLAIGAIRHLYEIESKAKLDGLTAELRHELRHQESKPLLEDFFRWLRDLKPRFLPKSRMGKAIGYALNQQVQLSRYLEDGRLSIDNNGVERQMRAIALGRNNWKFAGSDEGARRAAILYSIVNTCVLQGIEPWAYLTDVLDQLAADPSLAPKLTPRIWKEQRAAVIAAPS